MLGIITAPYPDFFLSVHYALCSSLEYAVPNQAARPIGNDIKSIDSNRFIVLPAAICQGLFHHSSKKIERF
jgi:hypothetical protein